MPRIVAHRGFSSRFPEATRAAYQAAIRWSAETGIELGLECDVHFSADDQLICLHDLSVRRTSKVQGRAIDLTVAQLKRLNFGSRAVVEQGPAGRELITLAELMAMVRDARLAGVRVELVIETKHPNPRGVAVEERVAELLGDFGWDRPGSPVRVISFSPSAARWFARQLPDVERSLLIKTWFGRWRDGSLPAGVGTAGVSVNLLKTDPGYVRRAHARGHQVHAWTVNTSEEIAFCTDLGVTGLTSDYPERVAEVLMTSAAVSSHRATQAVR